MGNWFGVTLILHIIRLKTYYVYICIYIYIKSKSEYDPKMDLLLSLGWETFQFWSVFGPSQPLRSIKRNKWLPVSSRSKPPSTFTPNDGRWSRQAWVAQSLSTLTSTLDPSQSLTVGLESSARIATKQSSTDCKWDWHETPRDINPQSWSAGFLMGIKEKRQLESIYTP